MSASSEFHFATSNLPLGLSVIEASAGTGKTYAISHLVPRLLLDGSIERLADLLLVTYTKDAAGELADRVRRVLGLLASPPLPGEATGEAGVAELRQGFLDNPRPGARERLDRALAEIDQLGVSTIHSFCQKTLQTEGALCGLPAIPELIPDTREVLAEAVFDLWTQHIAGDELLAAVASGQGWSLEADQRFAATYAGLEKPCFLPPAAERFQALQKHLRQELGRLPNAEIQSGLTAIISIEEKSWKKEARSTAGRHLRRLRESRDSRVEASQLEAVAFVAAVPEMLMGRSNADKALKDAMAGNAAVKACIALSQNLQAIQWSWQQFCAEQAVARVAVRLRENRQITYDGLISTLREALRREDTGPLLAQRLRERHRVAIIDESQDTDARQFGIFSDIFLRGGTSHRLVLIGDPKQAIYGFRGADLNTYLRARDTAARAGSGRLFSLTRTYRAPNSLVSAVNTLFSREHAFLNPGLKFTPATSGLRRDGLELSLHGEVQSDRLEAWLVPDEEQDQYATSRRRLQQVTRRTAGAILELLQHGSLKDTNSDGQAERVQPSDIAILTNSNREADAMAAALRLLGIPVVVSSADDVLATDEAAEMELLLGALLTPRRAGLRHAALSTRLLGYTASDLHALQADPVRDEACLELFNQWSMLWRTRGVAALFAEIEERASITLNLARGETGERRSANLRQIVGLLHEAALAGARTPEHQLRWLRQERTRAESRNSVEERQMQLESDERAVQIVTMHKSKGLEYRLVFCPFLWSALKATTRGVQVLRSATASGQDTLFNLDLGADTHPAELDRYLRAHMEDRIRLCYVALTRAKVKAWFFCGAFGNRSPMGNPELSALDWLLRPSSADPDLSSPLAFRAWSDQAVIPFIPGTQDGRGHRHRLGLQALQSDPEGGAHVSIKPPPAPASPGSRYNAAPRSALTLSSLPTPSLPEAWRMTSFTALTHERHARDGGAPAAPVAAQPGIGDEAPTASDNDFLAAPAGADIGTLVHDYIETWDFSLPRKADLRTHMERSRFSSRREDPAILQERLLSLLRNLRKAILPGLGEPLSRACPDPHGSEWHFHLPISPAGINGAVLAEVFERHAIPEHRPYAQALRNLSPDASSGLLRGFLQGFIDRLVRVGDSWGVIDWKTNKLGEDVEDYHNSALLQCAMDAHYYLQTHLYLLALRRFMRLTGSPGEPVGAWLVFLRAVRADSSQGILHINPGPELLDALESCFLGKPDKA